MVKSLLQLMLYCLLMFYSVFCSAQRLEVTVSEKTPFVQQTLIYSVRVVGQGSLATMGVTLPSVGQAIIKKIDGPRTYLQEIGARHYTVNEYRYAITPVKAGEITIPPVKVTATVVQNNRYPYQQKSVSRPFTLTSKPVTITVQSQPESANQWLPLYAMSARAILLDQPPLVVGRPARYRVEIEAVGSVGEDIPSLTELSKQNDFTLYLESSSVSNKVSKNGKTVHGKRHEIFALIPEKVGTFELPNARISWWNVKNNQQSWAEMLSHRIDVLSINAQSNPVDKVDESENHTIMYGVLLLITVISFLAFILRDWLKNLLPILYQRLDEMFLPVHLQKNVKQPVIPKVGVKFDFSTVSSSIDMMTKIPGPMLPAIFFQKLEKVHSPQAIVTILMEFAMQCLNLPNNSPLEQIAQNLCKQYPKLDGEAVLSLFNELEQALYGQQVFDSPDWHSRFKMTFKGLGWICFRQSSAEKTEALPNLNPQ
jgi:hypothetical protein